MLKDFRTYQLALKFHEACASQEGVPGYLRDQLYRASSSVALNLAEGSAKPSKRDQAKFYFIAMGSLRESQAALEFVKPEPKELKAQSDELGANLFCLLRATVNSRSNWKGGF